MTKVSAVLKFMEKNPDAKGKAIVTGVKEMFGVDIKPSDISNARAQMSKVTFDDLLSTKDYINKVGAEQAEAALTAFETLTK